MIFFSGCQKMKNLNNKQIISTNTHDKYPILNKILVEKNIESIEFQAIVDLSDSSICKIYMPNFPKYGGILWENAPMSVLNELFQKRKKDQTLWIVMKGRFVFLSSKNQINPATFSYYKFGSRQLKGLFSKHF